MAASSRSRPTVHQRSDHDCLLCALAMFTGRSYEDIERAARAIQPAYDAQRMAMTHALARRIAHDCGLVLLSSIYMNWAAPGIVGVVSRTFEDCGHALYWDGERLIDPGGSGLYDRAYVDVAALEFTQRAADLSVLIVLERSLAVAARNPSLQEVF